MKLLSEIYDLCLELPAYEKYGLASQMRRAALSIPSNISEGATRRSTKEYLRFLEIASGSIAELKTCLEFIQTREKVEASIIPWDRLIYTQKMLNKLRYTLKHKLESSR